MLLLLFGALNSGGRIQELGNIPYVTFFLPGILAYGIIITQFVNMAGGIAIQRDNGLLKRMRGTPLPGWAYVGGRVGSTALVSVVMTVVMLVLGRVCFDVHLRAEAVPAVVVTVLLGAATFAALGMAAVMLIPNAEAAPVVANVLILPLSFISGIWYPLTGAPRVARRPGEVLPGRAPGQRAARRLRPAQPRLGVVGQRPALARHLAAHRHAPGDALLAPGDGALSAAGPRSR